MRAETISHEYRKLQQELHLNPNYGIASLAFAPIVADIIRQSRPRSLSDYGAGKQNLLKALTQAGVTGFEYRPYLNNNVIIKFGVSSLLPSNGFYDLYNNLRDSVDPLVAAFVDVVLTY